jgi:hypothetical protein
VVHRRVMLFTRKKTTLSPPAQAFMQLVVALFNKRASTIRGGL